MVAMAELIEPFRKLRHVENWYATLAYSSLLPLPLMSCHMVFLLVNASNVRFTNNVAY
jgi:hypothetical protein